MAQRGIVGRGEQFEALDAALRRALKGESVVNMVTGEPGAGKTTLLHAFARRAQENDPELLVAYGACNSFTGSGDAYLPFREILRLLTGDVEQSLAEGRANQENASRLRAFMRMSGRALVENGPDLVDIFVPGGALLARLGGKAASKLPWAERLTHSMSGSRAPARDLSQENVFEQYTQVLEAISSERPVMLIVDDLHWADHASLGLLFHLSRRLVNDPVFILGAYRAEELAQTGGAPNPLKPIVAELKRIHGEIHIDLAEAANDDFVNAVLDSIPNRLSPGFREAIARHTGGNPMFVLELVGELVRAGKLDEDEQGRLVQRGDVDWRSLPSRVAGVIEARISHLTSDQQEMLEIASVQGDEFYAEIVSDLVEASRRSVIRQLSGPLGREHRIVFALGKQRAGATALSAYAFRHSLFGRYLYQRLDDIERVELHGETGEALEALAGEDPTRLSPALARHFSEAECWDKAIRFSVMAADYASEVRAPEDAINHFERALGMWEVYAETVPDFPAAMVMERLADQLVPAGRPDEAGKWYARAQSLVADDAFASCRLLGKRSQPLQQKNDYDGALALLKKAEDALGQVQKDERRWHQAWIDIQLQHCWIHYWRNEKEELGKRLGELLPVAQRWGTPQQTINCVIARSQMSLRSQRFRLGKDTFRELSAACEKAPEEARDAAFTFLLGFLNLWARDFPAAVDTFRRALALAQLAGDLVTKTRVLTYLSVAHRFLHQPEEVRALLPQLWELADFMDAADYQGVLLSQQAWLAFIEKDAATAGRHADEALSVWQARAPGYPFQWLALWIKLPLLGEAAAWEEARATCKEMLSPPLMRQPRELEARLRAIAESDNDRAMKNDLTLAVDLARKKGLL